MAFLFCLSVANQTARAQCGEVELVFTLQNITISGTDNDGLTSANELQVLVGIDPSTANWNGSTWTPPTYNAAVHGDNNLTVEVDRSTYTPSSICNTGGPIMPMPDDIVFNIVGWEDDCGGTTDNVYTCTNDLFCGFNDDDHRFELNQEPFNISDIRDPATGCFTAAFKTISYGPITGVGCGQSGQTWTFTMRVDVLYNDPAPTGSSVTINQCDDYPEVSVTSGIGGTYEWPDLTTGPTYQTSATDFDNTVPGTYNIDIVAIHQCDGGRSAAGTATVTVNALPNPPPIGTDVATLACGTIPILQVSGAAGQTFEWEVNGNPPAGTVSGANGEIYEPDPSEININTPGTYPFTVYGINPCDGSRSLPNVINIEVLQPCPELATVSVSGTDFCDGDAVGLSLTIAPNSCGITYTEGTDFYVMWYMDPTPGVIGSGTLVLDGRGPDGVGGTTDDLTNLSNTTYNLAYAGAACDSETHTFRAELGCTLTPPSIELGTLNDECNTVVQQYGGYGLSTANGYTNGCPGVSGSEGPATMADYFNPCTGQFNFAQFASSDPTGAATFNLPLTALPSCALITEVNYRLQGTSSSGCGPYNNSWASEANFVFYTPSADPGSANTAGTFSWSNAAFTDGAPASGGDYEFLNSTTALAGQPAQGNWQILFFDDYDDSGPDGHVSYVFLQVEYEIPPGCVGVTSMDAGATPAAPYTGATEVDVWYRPVLGTDFEEQPSGDNCDATVAPISPSACESNQGVTITYAATAAGPYDLASSPASINNDVVYYQVQTNGAPAGCHTQGSFILSDCCEISNVAAEFSCTSGNTYQLVVTFDAMSGSTDFNLDVDGNTLASPYAYATYETAPASGMYSITVTDPSFVADGETGLAVTVTDSADPACTDNTSFDEPESLQLSSTTSDYNGYEISCNGGSDGWIDLTVTGGVGPYSYNWSNGAGTAEDPSNLAAGSYVILVMDDNGCTATATITLTEPPLITLGVTYSNYNGYQVSCNGATDGSITINASGGTGAPAGWTYDWSNGATGNPLTGIGAGSYSVTVTDDNGCTMSAAGLFLREPLPLSCPIDDSDAQSCAGGATGEATVSTFGGVLPISSYAWSDGQTTATATGLATGNYDVTVTDANGCSCVNSVFVSEVFPVALSPSYLGANQQENNDTPGGPYHYNSHIILFEGGEMPYTFNWNNSGYVRYAIVAYPSDAGPGQINILYDDNASWAVSISDASGCGGPDGLTLTNDPAVAGGGSEILDIYNYEVTPATSSTSTDGTITVDVEGGAPAYAFTWMSSVPGWVAPPPNSPGTGSVDGGTGNQYLLSGLASGWYTLIVADNSLPTLQTTVGTYWVPVAAGGSTSGGFSRNKIAGDGEWLLQTIPSPVSGLGLIEMGVPVSDFAVLNLYTPDGRLVSELFSGHLASDEVTSLPFDSSMLPTGVYFLQLSTKSGDIQTQKLLIMR